MKLFENVRLFDLLLPAERFRFFRDLPVGATPGEWEKTQVLSAAEKALCTQIPQLRATSYMRFYRDGDRQEYDNAYFLRRSMLRALTMGEALERKGRFLEKIIDLAWLICEETTWVIPAHNYGEDFGNEKNTALTRQVTDEPTLLDLFSAERGAELANTLYFLREELDAVTPSITRRIEYSINKHVLNPFEKHLYWWEGYQCGVLENWNPWILSNVLTCAAVCERNVFRREALIEKAVTMLDRFVDSYALDGGCDEGPIYWTAAAAALFDCLELVYDLTDGKVSLFRNELVNNMCEYFRRTYVSGDYVMNFADSPAKLDISQQARLLHRMGRRLENPELIAFAAYAASRAGAGKTPCELSGNQCYRSVADLYEAVPEYAGGGVCSKADFPGIQVVVRREKSSFSEGFYFAMKGGHNAENHNHNDVGNFLVYRDGKPVVIDLGVGTYCRRTFSEERYTIPSMTSAYHNLPEIGGFAQRDGREYAAKDAKLSPNGLSVELCDAYPRECGLVSYVRSGSLNGEEIRVLDTLKLTEPKEVVFNFLFADRPELTADDEAKIGGCVFTWPKELKAELEAYVFDDERFKNTWERDRVWRLRLRALTQAGSYLFRIHPCQ